MSINIGGDILSSSGYTLNSEIVNDPKITTDGLVFWIDPGNLYSYSGLNSDYYDCYVGENGEPSRGCRHYDSDPGCYNCGDVLLDMSGYGNDARKSSPLVAVGYSDIGGFINFPGGTNCLLTCHRTDYLEHAYNFPDDTGEITIMAWVNPDSFTQQGNIVNCGFNSGYRCRITSSGTLWFYVSGNNITGGAISLNQWSLVTFTGDANGLAQYVNMTLGASNSTAFNPSNKSYLLIGGYNSTSERFDGQMGPLMIYDRKLSEEERREIYQEGLARFSNDTMVPPTPTPSPAAPTPTPTPTPSPSPLPTITISWGSESSYLGGMYSIVNRTGHNSPLIIRIDVEYTVGYTSYDMDFYYSINSTSSWTLADSIPKGSSETGTFSVSNIDYNDIVRIRYDNDDSFIAGGEIELNEGAVTSGGSGIVDGQDTWYI